jgi:LysM repeat protein
MKCSSLVRSLIFLTIAAIFSASLIGCTAEEQTQVQTAIAPAAETAAAEAERFVKTQTAHLQETAQAAIQTKAVSFKETAEAQVATESARLLATKIPATAPPPTGKEVITYTVVKGDNLSMIAKQFSTTVDALIQLNKERYPSLVTNPRYIEIGWILIVSFTVKEISTPAPTPVPTPWSTTPDCDVSRIYWLTPPITCEESVLDAVSEIGLSLGCVVWDDNPLGYYMTHTIYRGWILKDANNVLSYGWFVDKEKNLVVIGPAIVVEKTNYVECGIPGNP